MNVFLAARFERREELKVLRARIQALGHIVTSKWLDRDAVTYGTRLAYDDFYDLDDSSIVVFDATGDTFGLQQSSEAFIMFGYALGKLRDIWLVGSRPNVYCYRRDVVYFETWDTVLRQLGEADSR